MSPLSGTGSSRSAIKPAATVVLLRDSGAGPEVLLTKRPDHLRFMGGAMVFPGGALARADLDQRWERASTRTRASAAEALADEDGARALGLFVCALREAFEEVGYIAGEGPLDLLVRDDAERPDRFLERCLALGIKLDTNAIIPAGRWVTPEGSPVRFDARFFVTRVPQNWEPSADPAEVARLHWNTAAGALADLASGKVVMAPPTIEMLQRLDGNSDVDSVLASTVDTRWQGSGEVLTASLSSEVTVVLAPNPGALTGPGTNTYVVGGRGGRAVIDPAVSDPGFIESVRAAAREIETVLITHRHPDHVGGIESLIEGTGAKVRAYGSDLAGGVPVQPLHDDEILDAGGVPLRVVYSPGHSSDHVCFFDSGSGALFAGDNVLGEGTAVIAPPDGDMGDYLETLKRLRALGPRRIYPGHFRALDDGVSVIEGYLEHRAQRRAEILAALGSTDTVDGIVRRVYSDTPERLHSVAAHQVRAVLELLEREGLVFEQDGAWHVGHVN